MLFNFKKLTLLILGITLYSINIISQTDLQPGYIITESQDTLYGLIKNKGDISNSKKCIFKKNEDAKRKEFNPDELKGYKFTNGKYYISKTIAGQELFYEYLINGIVNLYYFRDGQNDHYFLENEEGEIFELKDEEKEIYKDGVRYVKNTKEYIGILKANFKKSLKTSLKAEYTQLNHKSLLKITEEYHNQVCDDRRCIIYEKKLSDNKWKIGVLAGYELMSLRADEALSDDNYYLQDKNDWQVTYPFIGLFLKKKMPRLNEKLSFQYEGTIGRINHNFNSNYVENIFELEFINDIEWSQIQTSNRIYLRYEFPRENIKPAIQIGGFFNYGFNVKYQRDLEVKFAWGDTYDTQVINESPFRKTDYGLSFGLGLTKTTKKEKDIFLDVKYSRGFWLKHHIYANIYSLNLGIQF